MNPKKFSKRHHYLPVFYLKGFSDTNQNIFVYDKIRDEIIGKQDPKSQFYKNHLNNFRINGEIVFSFEESIFTPKDTSIAPLFSRFRSTLNYQFTAYEKFELLHFLSQLYWRSPDTNEKFVELIKKEGFNNSSFGLRSKDGNKLTDEDIPEFLKKLFKRL
ncbi:DUF4238 domain-containing protein [Flavobacterium sp. N1718]|uniref:DUF4238 domain-containing protein n=1 Tax=Flavobacterium sp. N1718 TaxID=2986822 RepID=UPI0022241AFB|nr:DUF4238 domain-containing protein [Flavobacterium sp. N1718]